MSRLQTRLLAASFGVALVALAAVALAARQSARHEFLKFQDDERQTMRARRVEAARQIAAELDQLCCDAAIVKDAALRLDHVEGLLVLTADGRTLVTSAGEGLKDFRDLRAGVENGELHVELTRAAGQRLERTSLKFVVAGAPLTLADGRAALAYIIPVPSDQQPTPVSVMFGSLDRWLLGATVVASLLALGATWAATRTALTPIADLQTATADLAAGDFTRRVATTGPDEIAALAASFNRMASELETQQRLRRNLVHDVAHELRTPLAALRCRLEAAQDGLVASTPAEISGLHEHVLHLSQLVDDLQELTLAESRELRLNVAPIDLPPLISSAVRAAGLDQDRRVRVDTAADSMMGDVVRMRQVLTNLLTNAARHTPADGSITIRTRAAANGRVVVHVHNTGSALDPDQLTRLFDRFYRTDPSRQRDTGGSGLGLAIVKHLVEAQGGRVWAASDATGVTVGFDAAATSSRPPLPSAPSAPASGA